MGSEVPEWPGKLRLTAECGNCPDGEVLNSFSNAATAAYQLTGLSSGPTMCP